SPPAESREEDVRLAPEDALRPAGRAARVEDVEVVGRPLDGGTFRGSRREYRLVRERAGEERFARAVVDLEEDAELRQLGKDLGDSRREARVVDERSRSSIPQERDQLGGDVAVIDV